MERLVAVAPWAVSALLLAVPMAAMLLGGGVSWGPLDFALAGALLFGGCGLYELARRTTSSPARPVATGLTVATALALVWISLAVGIIADEGEPANLVFAGVLAIASVGAVTVRFGSKGMARVLLATAVAQLVGGTLAILVAVASLQGITAPLVLNAGFVVLWFVSAALFHAAARTAARTTR